jgi:1-acyl-sn-glycerol-3-phosphate acyltransferase
MKIDIDTLQEINPIANPIWAWGGATIANAIFTFTSGVEIAFENAEILRSGQQFIIATNHSHKLDFLPLRAPMLYRGHTFMTWVKSRAYKDPAMGTFLRYTGNVPICSRGYLIASDYWDMFGERPTEEEYRILRDHIDRGTELPASERFEALTKTPRRMLGLFFNPTAFSYRQAVRQLYYELMQIALRMTRRGVHRGDNVQIYPQGAVSSRMTPGHIGIIQAALTLGLPIVPVGISGCREVFIGNSPRTRAGKITVRFGEPYEVPRSEVPSDFRAFHPDDEETHAEVLKGHAAQVTQGINALLTPDYQMSHADDAYDGNEGLKRFF